MTDGNSTGRSFSKVSDYFVVTSCQRFANLILVIHKLYLCPSAQQRLQSTQPGLAEQSWLTIKEPITPNTREAGGGTDEVEELIRRHEAFRKAAATWKDHFSSLRQVIMKTKII